MLEQRDKLVDERKTMIEHKLRKAEEKRIQHIEGIRRYLIIKLNSGDFPKSILSITPYFLLFFTLYQVSLG